MNDSDRELLTGYLDGAVPDADAPRLQALLTESAEARRLLRDLATIDARLTELAALPSETVELLDPGSAAARAAHRPARSSRRVASGLAVGLLLGCLFSSAAWAYAVPRWRSTASKALVLVAESFESVTAPPAAGMPRQPDRWSGDFTQITAAEQGVAPAQGNKMLRLLRADYEGKPNAEGSYCGDLFRLIDVRPYRSELADGTAVVRLSAAFNALRFPENERYRCTLAIHALSAETVASLDSIPAQSLTNASLAMARKCCAQLDRDPATWQPVECELRVPAETDFLLMHLGVNHTPKSQQRITFDGHYVDDVRITLARQAP